VIAFLFPGQGAQFPGFLHTLGGATPHPAIRETLTEASDILNRNVLEFDEADALRSTIAVQLAIFIAGVAFARGLQREGLAPDAVAGLSVGAYGAAVACGAIHFHDALTLLSLRATLMEQAYPDGFGMLAVSGLTERELASLIDNNNPDPAFIANVNAPRQIVISGSDAALARVRDAALGAGTRRAERLAVSVPSHCRLFDTAARALTEAAGKIAFSAPSVPYIGNRGARALRRADAIADDLATNLAHPVRWHDSTVVLSEMGVRVMVEMPPGRTLTQLAADALPDLTTVAIEQMPVAQAVALINARAST
jgi:malonate decarboxylase epsilon subunit